MDLSHRQLASLYEKAKQINEEKYLEASKQRLNNIVSKKMQTCFIGALAAFEEIFGFLWGHNKDFDNLNIEEKEMRKLWEIVRMRILNNGNQQLRSIQSEIVNHTIKWNRYNLPLLPKKKEEE